MVAAAFHHAPVARLGRQCLIQHRSSIPYGCFNCRGGTPWPPVVQIAHFLLRRAATECRPYNCPLRRRLHVNNSAKPEVTSRRVNGLGHSRRGRITPAEIRCAQVRPAFHHLARKRRRRITRIETLLARGAARIDIAQQLCSILPCSWYQSLVHSQMGWKSYYSLQVSQFDLQTSGQYQIVLFKPGRRIGEVTIAQRELPADTP